MSLTHTPNFSLALGFSRVSGRDARPKPFQRLSRAFEKPLKRLEICARFSTRLKPGANEIFVTGRTFDFNSTELWKN